MYIHKLGGSWLDHPFWRKSFLLTDPSDIRAIVESGISELWIDESKGLPVADETQGTPDDAAPLSMEQPSSAQAIQQATSAASTLADTALTHAPEQASITAELERARQICQLARQEMVSLFSDARLGKTIHMDATLPLVDEINASVRRHAAALLSIARLKTHDDYTYLHSVAVCTMMVALGRQLGLNREQVRTAGHCGLMHDIGKALMPLGLLNKPDRLSEQEFNVMKQHPLAGAKMLLDGSALMEVQDVALHHHEKVDGSGYPHRLAGDQISLFARMSAICDVYDAITSHRPYKKAWDPAHAIRQMAKWEGHFDKRVFNAFVKTIGIYPVGSLVRLSSDRLAVVVEPNQESLLTPKVRAFFSLPLNRPIPIQTLDLSAPDCTDKIVGPEDAKRWGFDRLDDIWLTSPG